MIPLKLEDLCKQILKVKDMSVMDIFDIVMKREKIGSSFTFENFFLIHFCDKKTGFYKIPRSLNDAETFLKYKILAVRRVDTRYGLNYHIYTKSKNHEYEIYWATKQMRDFLETHQCCWNKESSKNINICDEPFSFVIIEFARFYTGTKWITYPKWIVECY